MSKLTFKEYETKAMSTKMDSSNNFAYMMLNLVSEIGELSGLIAKAIRKGKCSIDNNNISFKNLTENEEKEFMSLLRKEHGDCLWQIFGLGVDLFGDNGSELTANENIAKLSSRKERGVIEGSGDLR